MHFEEIHKQNLERVRAIDSFEGTRKRIDQLNRDLLAVLVERMKYPLGRNFLGNTNRRDELEANGIDAKNWEDYCPILELVCKEGDILPEHMSEVIPLQSKLDAILEERIYLIAKNVANHKDALGLPTEDLGREKEILERMRVLGREYGFEEDVVIGIFSYIIDKSKEIQNSIRKGISTRE